MQTVNQILSQFLDIASAHRQINSFGFGEIQDYATSGTTNYPAMWVDIGDCSIGGNEDEQSLYTQQSYTIWIIDRLQKGKGNLEDVFSDTQQIVLDVIAQLNKSGYDFVVDIGNQLTPIFDKFHDDELAGFSFNLVIKQNYDRDRCAIPFAYQPIPNTEQNPGSGTTVNTTYVPSTRTLTINGVEYDLSQNRSWTISTGSGTVTSVSALTLGTSGTDLTSTVASGTTTPVITLNVPTASASNRGALSSTDWSTFNNKGSGTITSVTGTTPIVSSGGTTPAISIPAATASANGYLTSTDWTTFNNKGSGTITSVTGTTPIVSSGGTTPAISIPAATTSANGYLSSTDWTTFNNKGSGTITSVTGTTPIVSSGGATPSISIPAATSSANGYLTSTDWTTFNAKTTEAYVDAAFVSKNAQYYFIQQTQGHLTASSVAATYFRSDTSSNGWNQVVSQLGAIMYLNPTDYPTVNGVTTKLRISATISTNNAAPGCSFTFGLYPLTRNGGGALTITWTIGTVISGSQPAQFVTPALNTITNTKGTDFAIPAAGMYAIGVITSATTAVNSYTNMNAILQYRNA